MDDKLKSALDKVTKLRALGDRATTQAEREAAYAQAEAIIAKYQIDVAQIEAATQETSEEIGEDGEPLIVCKNRVSWVGILAARLAKMHGCACIWRGGVAIIIAGRPSDVAVVRYLFAWLHVEIAKLSEREHGRAAKNAFRLGAVIGACDAMKRAQAIESKAAALIAGQSAAMVLVSRSEAAMASFGKVRGAGAPATFRGGDGAFERGKEAGASLAPRPGLTAGGHKMLGRAS